MKVHNEKPTDGPETVPEPEPEPVSRIQPAYAVCTREPHPEPKSGFRIFDAFPSTDPRQLARMLVRPRWFAHFIWELVSYLAWLVWNRRLPTPWNIPFSLVFAWPEPPPTREQISRFNAEREESVRQLRQLKSSLEELRILVENAKRERVEKAELSLGDGI